MYVPTTEAAIRAQFDLTNSEIQAIKDIHQKKAIRPAMAKILRKKHILMPRHDVLTATGQRIAERIGK